MPDKDMNRTDKPGGSNREDDRGGRSGDRTDRQAGGRSGDRSEEESNRESRGSREGRGDK